MLARLGRELARLLATYYRDRAFSNDVAFVGIIFEWPQFVSLLMTMLAENELLSQEKRRTNRQTKATATVLSFSFWMAAR